MTGGSSVGTVAYASLHSIATIRGPLLVQVKTKSIEIANGLLVSSEALIPRPELTQIKAALGESASRQNANRKQRNESRRVVGTDEAAAASTIQRHARGRLAREHLAATKEDGPSR
eukprot:226914-Prymnesium_polylepis.1